MFHNIRRTLVVAALTAATVLSTATAALANSPTHGG
jgi:hypothetical protein